MSDFNSESFPENEWDECGDLAWNEFDWERYLRDQDDVLHRYLAFYERLKDRPDRIDEVASLMGWDTGQPDGDSADAPGSPAKEETTDSAASGGNSSLEPYTLHKNPVFVATKAIYLSLKRSWERVAGDPGKVGQPLALEMQTSLYRGEEQAILGVHAIDLGDYALAISLFKRALQELNQTLALAADSAADGRVVNGWRAAALPRLFDLREIWLRVISECREELERRVDEEG
jgi:hypothetical protein